MIKFQRVIFLFLLLPILLLLQSCQSDFVQSQSSYYARQLGIVNNFSISRWHNRRIEPSASITVVSDTIEQLDAVILSQVVADNLAPYFHRVEGGAVKGSLVAAQSLAKKQGSDFLFYLEFTDPSSLFSDEEPSSSYNKLQLTMTLVDVVSSHTLDKIVLTAKSSWVSLLGDDMQSLLAKPINKIAQDLTGI